MTYRTLFLEPLREMTVMAFSFISPVLTFLVILIFGWIIVKFIERLIITVLTMISFDKVCERVGFTRILETGDIRHKPSQLFGSFMYLLLMVMILITTAKLVGFGRSSVLLDGILSYVPNVVTGVLVLIVGMLVAKVVSGIVYVTAKNTDMPSPTALARLSKFAIMVYVTIMFLREIGVADLFEGGNYTILIGGLVFAMALAFGLAGKEVAGKYLDVFKRAG